MDSVVLWFSLGNDDRRITRLIALKRSRELVIQPLDTMSEWKEIRECLSEPTEEIGFTSIALILNVLT